MLDEQFDSDVVSEDRGEPATAAQGALARAADAVDDLGSGQLVPAAQPSATGADVACHPASVRANPNFVANFKCKHDVAITV